jgi:hypothetical protein
LINFFMMQPMYLVERGGGRLAVVSWGASEGNNGSLLQT